MFEIGDKVIYIPQHAYGNIKHDCEIGTISSYNDKFYFVRFDNDKQKACSVSNLIKLYGDK